MGDRSRGHLRKKRDIHSVYGRSGAFAPYDALSLYYVGMGGNNNSTSRFRKYEGTGKKRVLQEHTDAVHKLRAGATYVVQCVQYRGRIQYIVDGKVFFDYQDPKPLQAGRFAFRSLNSRKLYHWVKVYRLEPGKPTGLLRQREGRSVDPFLTLSDKVIANQTGDAVELLGREALHAACGDAAAVFRSDGLRLRACH